MDWYGSHTTGIIEIDCQHANLDTLLGFALRSPEDGGIPSLERFADGMAFHFDYEENYEHEGKAFTDPRHRVEHRRLENLLKFQMARVRNGDATAESVATAFLDHMATHASEFDQPAATGDVQSP